jgi:2-oxoisovalerate dehydrogenase E1 component
MSEALNGAFRELLSRDERVLLLGEDIESPYGGAFKVTRELSSLFPGRVLNMPISEAALVGLGTGLAAQGYRPFIEIMFGDFLGLAFDQVLNHASKLAANVVIRTPMGGGRGYGPTHSQTLERHFFGIPGLRIVALSLLHEPRRILDSLLRMGGTQLLIENKLDYSRSPIRELPAGFTARTTDDEFPTVLVEPKAVEIDATLIGYGGMAGLLIEAAERLFVEHDLICQILCPAQIHPFRVTPLLDVISRAGDAFIVEEGQLFGGFGAEIAAQLAEAEFPGRCHRIGPADRPVPASRALEREALPTVENIVRRVAAWAAPR